MGHSSLSASINGCRGEVKRYFTGSDGYGNMIAITPDLWRKEMAMVNRVSTFRQVIGDLLLVLFCLLTADVVIVMVHKMNAVVLKEDYQKVFRYELILCLILLFFAMDVRFNLFSRSTHTILRIVGWILRITVFLFSGVILFFFGKVVAGSLIQTADQADYALVLGLALENGEPTNDLLARLDKAQEYLEEYPEAHLILTGGNADASGHTEADVMRDILTGRGVPEEKLVLEDRSKTTVENFRNVAEMIPPEKPIVMISSDYHMDRAVRNAKEAGFSNVMRLSAPSDFLAYGANMVSEVILNLNDLTKK